MPLFIWGIEFTAKNDMFFRDLSEISRGGRGGGKQERVTVFEPFKREGYEKKMTGKEGGSQEIKPP